MPKSTKKNGNYRGRRRFLKSVTLSAGALVLNANAEFGATGESSHKAVGVQEPRAPIDFPRTFTGGELSRIAFPLGGIGTGSISLGGRGQLRDWEIFNRPDKGNRPDYALPAVWVQARGQKPVARVLESRFEPPYESADGWGMGINNVPGLPRLQSTTFKGAFPFAWIDFHDDSLPVRFSLEAFNPLVPLDADASGLPVALLRYTIKNPLNAAAKVGVSYSLQNPVDKEGKQCVFREDAGLCGLYMDNPFLTATDPLTGSFVLCVLGAPVGSVSYLRGWKRPQWWNGVLAFWDDFTADGALDTSSPALMPVGSLAVTQTVPPGARRASPS